MLFVEIGDLLAVPTTDEQLKGFAAHGHTIYDIDPKTDEKTVVYTKKDGWLTEIPAVVIRRQENE